MAMEIKQVTDPAFGAYGKIITGYDCGELLAAMEQTPVPEDTIYVASDAGVEKLPVCRHFELCCLKSRRQKLLAVPPPTQNFPVRQRYHCLLIHLLLPDRTVLLSEASLPSAPHKYSRCPQHKEDLILKHRLHFVLIIFS